MSRSIHAYVVAELRNADLNAVFAATKISKSTLAKIRDGHIPNPGIQSIEALYFYFRDDEGRRLRRRAA